MMRQLMAFAAALILAGSGLPASAAEQLVTPRELLEWAEEGRAHLLVDVRWENHYAAAHIPQAVNIPALVINRKPLPAETDIVLYDNDLSGRTARAAAEKLNSIPATRVFLLDGGMRAWDGEQLPIVREGGVYNPSREALVTAEDLREALLLGQQVTVLDLRDNASFKAASIPGARNVALLRNPDEAAEATSDRLQDVVNLASRDLASALPKSQQTARRGMLEEALAAEIASEMKKVQSSLPRGTEPPPVVLVDGNGALSTRVLPYLLAQDNGSAAILVLERGLASWDAISPLAPERSTHTITHGSSTFEAPQE